MDEKGASAPDARRGQALEVMLSGSRLTSPAFLASFGLLATAKVAQQPPGHRLGTVQAILRKLDFALEIHDDVVTHDAKSPFAHDPVDLGLDRSGCLIFSVCHARSHFTKLTN